MTGTSWRSVLSAVSVMLALSLIAGAGEATPITVLSALSAPDETEVSLSGVVVDKVVSNPPYIVVREPWSSEIRLIVLLEAPAEVQRFQTVDVTGLMTTLETDARAITASSVYIYKDTSGRTALMPLPVLRGDNSFILDEAPSQPSQRGEQMMESDGPPVMPDPDPTEGDPAACDGTVTNAFPLPIAAKCQVDGQTLDLEEKVVSIVGQGWCYIQEQDRSCGIRLEGPIMPAGLAPGDRLTVTGILATTPDGERTLEATAMPVRSAGIPPTPLQMRMSDVGGEERLGQVGPTGGVGQNNVGLLVRVAGKIIDADAGEGKMIINDGSLPPETGVIVTRPKNSLLSVGDIVQVTGVSGLALNEVSQTRDRMIRDAAGGGLRVLADEEDPTVSIETESFDPCTTLEGTANDDKLLAKVEVSFDAGAHWYSTALRYDSASSAFRWARTWLDGYPIPTGEVEVTARAVDGSGRVAVSDGIEVRIADTCAQTVGSLKALADGSNVALAELAVSRSFDGGATFYVQAPTDSMGIRVRRSFAWPMLRPGDEVRLRGRMATEPEVGERYIQADALEITDEPADLLATAMMNRTLGGGPLPGAVGPHQPGVTDGTGLNNIGLLVKVFGSLDMISQGVGRIDDGSLATNPPGVLVELPAGIEPADDGSFVLLTGISAVKPEDGGATRARLVRVANADDIQMDDVVEPSATIADDHWTVEGTATDNFGVAHVMVRLDGGAASEAQYDAKTDGWWLDPPPAAGDYAVSVTVTDVHDNTGTAARQDVTVISADVRAHPTTAMVPDAAYGTAISWWSPKDYDINVGPGGGNGIVRKSPIGSSQSGFWNDYALARLKESGVRTIRLGDMASNWWNWRLSLDPVGANRPLQTYHAGGVDIFTPGLFGIMDLKALCGELGQDARAVITLPIYKKTGSGYVLDSAPARNLVLLCSAPYPAAPDPNWAVSKVDNHSGLAFTGPQGQGYYPNPSETLPPYYVDDYVAYREWTALRPGQVAVFKCKVGTGSLGRAVTEPLRGTAWDTYWEFVAATETADPNQPDKTWYAYDDADSPAPYWGWVRKTALEHEEPFQFIAGFEFGNEPFNIGVPAEDYLGALAALRDSLYEAGVQARIGAPLPSERETQGTYLVDALTPYVRRFDFAIPHLYVGHYDPAIQDELQALFYELFYGNTWFRGATKALDSELAGYAEHTSKAPDVWVTELNTRYGFFDANAEEGHRPHNAMLKAALATAALQLDLAAKGAIGSALFHALDAQPGNATASSSLRMIVTDKMNFVQQSLGGSALNWPVERRWVTPTYYSQKLLNLLGRGRVDNTTSAVDGVIAQSFQDGDKWRVFLINTDPTNSKTGVKVWVNADAPPPYAVLHYELTGTNGMNSSNEDCAAQKVVDPAITLEGVAQDRLLTVNLPAASLVVLEADPGMPSVVGVLTDAQTGRPLSHDIPDAHVAVTGGSQTYTANYDRFGVFRLSGLAPGEYSAQAVAEGHFPVPVSVTVPSSGPAFVSLTADPGIRGTVLRKVDESTQEAVAGAAVWTDGGAFTVSDCTGAFVLPRRASGVRVWAQHPAWGDAVGTEVFSSLNTARCVSFILGASPTAELCN